MDKFLTYEMFGAVGDGVADDIDAIAKCHAAANATGTPVKAKDGAKYYIGCRAVPVTVKTDVDFGTAEFIIDDTGEMENRDLHVFNVESDFPKITIDNMPLVKKGQKKIDFPYRGRYFVRVFNNDHKIFIRWGLNHNSGDPLQDCFIVDEEGNILHDIDWDYDHYTKVEIRRDDDKPITIRGGVFRTLANTLDGVYRYYRRGICIHRSHVTVEGLTHLVEGEAPDYGCPYAGFIFMTDTSGFTLKNCHLTPHKTYFRPADNNQKCAMGSYDINFGSVLDTRLENITQSVDIHDRAYWGLIHTNYSKNLVLENCTMSRYDAHQGVTNLTVKNCTFGHQCVNLIGHGDVLFENCTVTGGWFVSLRADYGSHFDGNLTIRNCHFNLKHPNPDVRATEILGAYNPGTHDFGFKCSMPVSVTVDGLTVDDSAHPNADVCLLSNYDNNFAEEKPFPYTPTKKLTYGNVRFTSGKEIKIYRHEGQYPDLEIKKI